MSDFPVEAVEPAGGPATGSAFPPPVPESVSEPPPVPASGIRSGRALLIVFAYIAVQIAVGIAVGVVVGMYYGLTRGALTSDVIAEMQRVIVLPAAALSVVGGGIVAFLMTRRILPGPIRGGALTPVGWSAARVRDIALAACAGVVVAVLYVFVLRRLFPAAPGQKWGPVVQALSAGGWQRLLWAVIALFVAPPVEEFVFRGVLWTGLARGMKAGVAAVAVTLLFVLCHITEIRGYWPAWVTISAVGLGAIALRVRGESLVPPIVLHASYNAVLVAAIYLAA